MIATLVGWRNHHDIFLHSCLPILPTAFSLLDHFPTIPSSFPASFPLPFSHDMDILQSASGGSHSSSTRVSSSEFSAENEYQDPLFQLASELDQQEFTSYKKVVRSLESRAEALLLGQTYNQFLLFSSVTPAQAFRLSDDASQISKNCRFSFNTEMGILITKLIPYAAHQTAIRSFDYLIMSELCALKINDEVRIFGSATVDVGNWTKEADCCWAPSVSSARLSFVVEVGLSNSTRKLCLDARSWLETPSSSVKVVITIVINHSNPEVTIRRWELVSREAGAVTRASPLQASCTTMLRVSRSNNTTSMTGESQLTGVHTNTTRLTLPFDKIVGRSPRQPLERDILISEQQLRSFAERIWEAQGLF